MPNKIGELLRDKKFILLCLALFFFSFLFRLFLMNNGLWHHDSVQTAYAVEDFVKEGNFHGISGGKQGLILIYSLIFLVPYYIFNVVSAEYTVTFLTIIFASLGTVTFFLWLRLLLKNDIISFSAAMLYSFSPLIMIPTTYATSHGLDIFVLTCSFYLLFLSFECNPNYSTMLSLFSSFLLGFSLFVRPVNILLVIPYFLVVFLKSDLLKKGGIKNRIVSILPFIAPFLALLGLFFIINWKDFFSLAGYNKFLGMDSLINSYYGIGHTIYTITIIGLIFSVLGLIYLIITRDKILIPLLSWFIIMLIYHSNVSSYTPRFLITSIIPMFIFLGFGFLLIYKFNKYAAILIVIFTLYLMISQTYPILKSRHQYSGVKEYSLFVKDNTEPNALIIMYGDDDPFLRYYANRSGIPCNINNLKEIYLTIDKINERLKEGVPVYISRSCIIDREAPLYDAIFKLFNTTKVGEAIYEDYHKTDLRLKRDKADLYMVTMKNL